MIEWKEETVEPVREKRQARLKLTDRVVISVEDYGFRTKPILVGLHCVAGSMDGPFEEARDSVPAKVLALMEEAMPVLRALVQGDSPKVEFPAAVDPVAAIERG